jgi:hypothetical protein
LVFIAINSVMNLIDSCVFLFLLTFTTFYFSLSAAPKDLSLLISHILSNDEVFIKLGVTIDSFYDDIVLSGDVTANIYQH